MVKSFMPFMRNCFPFYGTSGEVHLTFRDEAVLKLDFSWTKKKNSSRPVNEIFNASLRQM
jgi:hypothetical protein